MLYLLFFLFFSFLFPDELVCPVESVPYNRSFYSPGDTLSIEDQNLFFSVCNGSGSYETGSTFSFSDYNGNINGGDYKITLISMNATW
ncbi:MAG: hypothetical protein CMG66_02415 [Candidatus Marinimicrobia bacterium]|nr:hypothetical protein [Candidatus Neomarinimicrobiota bacterium]|tara:strand:- start:22954 stop:23217 length:264 start_codon:yes stop_codon:yes gene_type:complete